MGTKINYIVKQAGAAPEGEGRNIENPAKNDSLEGMTRVRKLQYIGNQYLLNIPRSFVERSNWDKGDYFNITYMDKDNLQISKIADSRSTKTEALIPQETQEATNLFNLLLNNGWQLGPAEFPSLLGDLSHLLGKIRKRQIMILRPAPPILRQPPKR